MFDLCNSSLSTYPSRYEWTHLHRRSKARKSSCARFRPEDEPVRAEIIGSLSEAIVDYRFFVPVKQINGKSMTARYATSTTTVTR